MPDRADVAPRSMADDAREAARERFVGREAELDRLVAALGRPQSSVLWVFGPGGVGKSALLDAMRDHVETAGAATASLDLRTIDTSPQALSEALLAAMALAAPHGQRTVGFLDTFERATGLERFVREDLLARLPAGTVVVIAGRQPPSIGWRTDPAWSALLERIPLRNLTPDAAAELLERAGLAAKLRGDAVRLAGGHPLALVLLAEVLRTTGAATVPEEIAAAPDLVAGLLGCLVDEAPDDDHRRALDIAALARVTTRGLLRAVLGDDSGPLYDWLAERSYVDVVIEGLCPHDLARDVLEGDLRRNDPELYAETHHAIRQHVLSAKGSPGRADALMRDIVHLHRGSSVMSPYWDWASWGAVEETEVRAGDADALAAILCAHNDAAALPALEHWVRTQPEAFTVLRGPDGTIVGFMALLVLARPADEDLAADPVVAATWEHASRHNPPRPGQVIGINRYFEDAAAGQGASPTFNVLTVRCTRQWLLTPGLGWGYLTLRDAQRLRPLMRYLDMQEITEAHTDLGATRHFVFGRDWRASGPDAWLDLMETRELGEPVETVPLEAPVLVALDEEEFAAAVKDGLRALSRPDILGANPLGASRVVRDMTIEDPTAALTALLRAALAAIPDEPRTAKPRAALDRTYFHGAVSQEAAAEVLDLAFSTYRRHLVAGTNLLVDVLWRWELYGRDG